MTFAEKMKGLAKDAHKHLVLPEGLEPRTVRAARIIADEGIAASVTLIGNEAEVRANAEKLGVSLEGIEVCDPEKSDKLAEFAKEYYELRKHKGMPAVVSGFSENVTSLLLGKGYGIDDIAMVRGLKKSTICGHIAKLIQTRKITDYNKWISENEYERIIGVWRSGGDLRQCPDIDYDIVPIALAVYRTYGS